MPRTRPGSQRACRATVTRRLCTIAGFFRYAVEEELLDHSPAAHVRWQRLDYESHATALDRNELGALLVAAGLGSALEHAQISLLVLNGLRVSEASGADIEHLGLERGHRTLTITPKGGKVVTIPPAPRTARAIDLAIGERADGPVFLTGDGGPAGPARRRADRPPGGAPGSPRPSRLTRSGTRSSPARKREMILAAGPPTYLPYTPDVPAGRPRHRWARSATRPAWRPHSPIRPGHRMTRFRHPQGGNEPGWPGGAARRSRARQSAQARSSNHAPHNTGRADIPSRNTSRGWPVSPLWVPVGAHRAHSPGRRFPARARPRLGATKRERCLTAEAGGRSVQVSATVDTVRRGPGSQDARLAGVVHVVGAAGRGRRVLA